MWELISLITNHEMDYFIWSLNMLKFHGLVNTKV